MAKNNDRSQRSRLREQIKQITNKRFKARKNALRGVVGTQQLGDVDVVKTSTYRTYNLLKPLYDPVKLYAIVEQSSVLPQCIDAMVRNIDGFGYDLHFLGTETDSLRGDVQEEKKNIEAFFDKVNENQSFTTVRQLVRQDVEATGNGYFEVVRLKSGEIGLIYYLDCRYTRVQALQDEPVYIQTQLMRGGRLRNVRVAKYFRRYAMVSADSQRIRWFKEFGDPRPMDADTGEYATEGPVNNPASEVIHVKIGTGVYGRPRWIGNALTAMGMTKADFVNYDLFDNQLIPPMAIMVSGGVLTDESVDDISELLLERKGVKNFNKVLILEAQSEGAITDKSATQVKIQELSSRSEDAMFVNYTESGEKKIRTAFRLPDLYLGRSEAYSKSTADSSRMVAEEQIFVPLRAHFDELVNSLIMPELKAKNWKFVSKGPRLITGEDIINAYDKFAQNGVYSINDGIRLSNNVLGTNLVPYDRPWAEFPSSIVVALAQNALLGGMDELFEDTTQTTTTTSTTTAPDEG